MMPRLGGDLEGEDGWMGRDFDSDFGGPGGMHHGSALEGEAGEKVPGHGVDIEGDGGRQWGQSGDIKEEDGGMVLGHRGTGTVNGMEGETRRGTWDRAGGDQVGTSWWENLGSRYGTREMLEGGTGKWAMEVEKAGVVDCELLGREKEG